MEVKTKQSLHSMRSEAVRIEYSKDVYDAIYDFFDKIGALGLIPIDGKESKEFITDWHETFIENQLFPMKVPFLDVYRKFFKAVIHGQALRKGNNVAAMIECYNHWYVKSGGNAELFPDYHHVVTHSPMYEKPNPLPKEIEDWEEKDIIEAYESMQNIWGTDLGKAVLNIAPRSQGKTYFQKIVAEYKKRGYDKPTPAKQ